MENKCRICFMTNKNEFIKPCKCNSLIHKKCLKKWIQIKKNPEYCEICKFKYNVDFTIVPINQTAFILENNDYHNKNNYIISIISIILILVIYLLFK